MNARVELWLDQDEIESEADYKKTLQNIQDPEQRIQALKALAEQLAMTKLGEIPGVSITVEGPTMSDVNVDTIDWQSIANPEPEEPEVQASNKKVVKTALQSTMTNPKMVTQFINTFAPELTISLNNPVFAGSLLQMLNRVLMQASVMARNPAMKANPTTPAGTMPGATGNMPAMPASAGGSSGLGSGKM